MKPSRVVISPRPGRPEQAGISVELIRRLAPRMPMLGVCFGHQAIGVAFGGRVRRHRVIRHGKCSPVAHDGRGVFDGLEQGFTAARYHSLVVSEEEWPADLEVGARATDDGAVMGTEVSTLPAHGVQFHPESILTDVGCRLMQTFLEI